MPKSKNSTVDRRDFLKSAAAGAAVLVSSPGLAEPQRSEAATTAPAATPQAAAILKMKEKVALATRMLAREGIVGSSGHVSMRIPGTDHVLIGPEDVTRNILGADDVVTVDLNTNQIEGKHHRPDETEIHTGIYRARPDVICMARPSLERRSRKPSSRRSSSKRMHSSNCWPKPLEKSRR